jgi:DNA-binding transcriptional MerR regulator
MTKALEPHQLLEIEREHPVGLPARAVVEIFRPLGVRLSEATFRKYVQAGLLPRSRRVGRKGKHRGSHGLYPVGVVRRINVIKKMMAEGMTLEEIRRSFVYFHNEIEELERVMDAILNDHLKELEERRLPEGVRRDLERQVAEARKNGVRLIRQLEGIASRLVSGEHHEVSQDRDSVEPEPWDQWMEHHRLGQTPEESRTGGWTLRRGA